MTSLKGGGAESAEAWTKFDEKWDGGRGKNIHQFKIQILNEQLYPSWPSTAKVRWQIYLPPQQPEWRTSQEDV